VVEVDLPERAEWMMSHRGVKVRVGKKKREACYGYSEHGSPIQLLYDRVLSWDHHRHHHRWRYRTTSYDLSLRDRR